MAEWAELGGPVTGTYKPKGDYTFIDGLKTYHTGHKKASKGIIVIYDIYGFHSNTLQGADILAHSAKPTHQIFMPDFFEGNTMQPSWQAPTASEEDKAKAPNWWATQGSPDKTVKRMPKLIAELKEKHPEIKEWGVLGFCWGGKVVSLVTQSPSLFKIAATAHPAFPLPGAAAGVSVPILLLPTKGEKKEVVDEWVKGLKVKHDVVRFDNQNHGFMAAKGDLTDPDVAKGYFEGYQKLIQWFSGGPY